MGNIFKKKFKFVKGVFAKTPKGKLLGGDEKKSKGGGYRGEAASQIIDINRQGGSGQVKFKTEK